MFQSLLLSVVVCCAITYFITNDLLARRRVRGWIFNRNKEAFQDVTVNKVGLERFRICKTPTYQRKSLGGLVIYTMDEQNIQAVCTTKLNDWAKNDQRGGAEPFFGNGLLSKNGEAWKHTRGLVNPLFKRAEISDIDGFEKYVERLIALIPHDGSTIDMQPLLRKLFIDSSTEFIFGESIDSLRDPTPRSTEFIDAFNRAVAGAGQRTMSNSGLSFFYKFDDAWKKDCKVVHDFIDQCIVRHRSLKPDADAKRKRYVLIEGMSKEIQDPVQLRFELLNIFSPARETIAMATSNMLFLLARNPDIWARLREQVVAVSGRPVTLDLLKSLPLFRQVVHESFRIHSPVTKTRRIAVRDTILPHGGGSDGLSPAFVPRGSMIYLDNYPMWQNKETWGEDVDAFRPERFHNKLLNWNFAPFFGGPRICPANQQVIVQCSYLLLRLVQEFKMIENRDSRLDFNETIRMCYENQNGCKVAFVPS